MKYRFLTIMLLSCIILGLLLSSCAQINENETTGVGGNSSETESISESPTESSTESPTESETEPRETAIPPEDFAPFASENTVKETEIFAYSYRILESDIRRGGSIKVEVTMKNCSGEEYHAYVNGGMGTSPYVELYSVNSDGTHTSAYDFWEVIDGESEQTYAVDEIQMCTQTLLIPADAPFGFYSFKLSLGGPQADTSVGGSWFENVFFLSE